MAYELVTPVDAGSANVARQLAEVHVNRTAMNLALIFGTVGLLLVPAVLFAAGSARRRTPGLAIAAGSIAFAGYLSGIVVTLVDALLAAAAGVPDRAAALALGGGLLVQRPGRRDARRLRPGSFGRHDAARSCTLEARLLPGWAAAGLIVAIPVEVGGVVSGAGHAAGAIAYGLVATAFLLCALRLLRTRSDGWDLAPAPQVEGKLPAADLPATR